MRTRGGPCSCDLSSLTACMGGVQEVLGLMQKSVRRWVLFNDDIELVTQALEKVGHDADSAAETWAYHL